MSGGMRPKLQACVDAIHGGVHFAHIIDGRLPHSLLLELFTDAGIGTKVRPARMTDALMRNYARFPVEFVRGEGVRLWDSEGNEYLDFLTGISVCNTGHCHPRVVAAVQEQVARLMHVGNLYFNRPMVELAERLAARSLGGRVVLRQLGRGGERGRAQARAQGAPARGDRRAARRLPRAHVRRALGDAAGGQAGAVRPARPRLRRRRARRRGDRRRGRRAHRRRAARADAGRERREPDRHGGARARPAPPATARAPRSSSTRSRPAWGARGRCGPTRPRASSPTR